MKLFAKISAFQYLCTMILIRARFINWLIDKRQLTDVQTKVTLTYNAKANCPVHLFDFYEILVSPQPNDN